MNGAVWGFACIAGAAVLVAWLYNRLVRLRNLVRSSWSDIDVFLKKRYDLVDNLVEAVKGYAAHEKTTLQGVTEARTSAMRAARVGERGEREAVLEGRLAALIALAEGYPDLKASEGFLALQKQLVELENGIEYARRYYNAVVRDYNSATETFPSTLVASFFRFAPGEFFRLDSPKEGERTDVRLS
jgi:LemA protein